MKRKPNSWESVVPIELRHLKYPSNSFVPAVNHKANQEIGIIWAGQTMIAYAILGIISIYGVCAAILAFRLIRSNRQAKKRLQSIERAKTAAAMEQLLAEAYRILNNHVHGSPDR